MVVPNQQLNTILHKELTDRPAPLLPGLYSMQAVSEDPTQPDVTVYRLSAKEADEWKTSMAMYGCYKWFLLRSDTDKWDIFDKHGKFVDKRRDVVEDHVKEVNTHVEVDRDEFLREAREALGDDEWSLVSCIEGHAGASAADHSNYVVVCRRMIIDAKPGDIHNMCIIDSKQWDCRVSGVFARVGRLSNFMQDTFLDRVTWIEKSWPLLQKHHRDTLADRLVNARGSYVRDLLQDCGYAAGMSRELILSMITKWTLASPSAQYRFAQHIVTTLQDKMIFEAGKAEIFEPAYIERKGSEVVSDYRRLLT